jgi:hypothetical protein
MNVFGGTDTKKYIIETTGTGVAIFDYDNDGWLDLFIVNGTTLEGFPAGKGPTNHLYRNNHDGTFSEMGGRSGVAYDKFGSTRGAMGIDTGRFHDDDTVAISIGNFANEMTALYVSQQRPLQFADEAIVAGIGPTSRGALTFGVLFLDYDLDGRLDLLTANGHIEDEINKVQASQQYAQPPHLFWNTGGAGRPVLAPVTATMSPDLARPMVARGAAIADIDGDGDLDLVLTAVKGPPRLLRNDLPPGHHWLRLSLQGTRSNRDAIGSIVEVRAGNQTQRQTVMPTRGYLSQSERVLTFGLGDRTLVDEVRIRWPDGSTAGSRSSRNR